jgi:hypothetical protein
MPAANLTANRRKLLLGLLLIAGPAILFGPMLAKGDVLYWGTPLLQFTPWHSFALTALAGGHLPLWNPLLGMGAPLLANYQSAVLYPPNWLLAVTGVGWGQGLLVALHIGWSALGMLLLARRLKLGDPAALVAALAFSLSGYGVARAGFLSINAAMAWLPWEIWAAEGLVARGAASGFASVIPQIIAAGLMLSMQWLAGHAQTAWYSLLLVIIWVAVRGWERGRLSILIRVGALLGTACLLAAMLSAAQLAPTFEYLMQSQRGAHLDEVFALTYSFWPWRVLGLVAPNLFGNPATGNYWGYGNYWEDAVYIGVLPLVMALAAAIRCLRRNSDPIPRMLLAVSLIAGLLSLGKNTAVYPFLFRHVPTFNLFQAPTRWNLLAIFCLSLLAGWGVEHWQTLTGKGLYWTRLGTAGAAGMAVVSLAVGPRLEGINPSIAPAFAIAGLFLAITGGLALLRPKQPGEMWTVGIGLFVLADLVFAGWGLNPSTGASINAPDPQVSRMGQEGRLFMPAALEYQMKYERLFRFSSFSSEMDPRQAVLLGLPNTAMLSGAPSASNFDPLLPARYVDWMQVLETASPHEASKMLQLMGVGWQAVSTPAGSAQYLGGQRASRVRVVPMARLAESKSEALGLLFAEDFDPDIQVVVEGRLPEGLPQGGEGRATIEPGGDPNRVAVHATAPAGGWLVLSDTWYPGWKADVDGQPAPILRADYLFRAVWLEPGDHLVTFSYQPASFVAGALISLLAWSGVIIAGILRWRD